MKENYDNATTLIILDHHLVNGSRFITLDQLASSEIYSIFLTFILEIRIMTIILTGQQSTRSNCL